MYWNPGYNCMQGVQSKTNTCAGREEQRLRFDNRSETRSSCKPKVTDWVKYLSRKKKNHCILASNLVLCFNFLKKKAQLAEEIKTFIVKIMSGK